MRKHNAVGIFLFCGFLAVMACGYLLASKEFSQMEKRYLTEKPTASLKAVLSGDWSRQAEQYLSDHVLLRNFYVGVNAYAERLAGRQKLKDIWAEKGRLLEAPAAVDAEKIGQTMASINAWAENLQRPVHLMVIPSAGWVAGVEGYADEEALETIYASAGPSVSPIAVEECFRGQPELYYRTDHHWTSRGAYIGYAAAANAMGREVREEKDFSVTEIPDFYGSTYSRSALWLTPPESLELWQGAENISVTNESSDVPHEGIFYPERLEQADKYPVFLDGNHAFVRVKNPEKAGKLLIIRDSFANCLGGFLAQSYGEVVLVDLRYYRQAVSELVRQEAFDDILICYSCSNFLTDTNLRLLR